MRGVSEDGWGWRGQVSKGPCLVPATRLHDQLQQGLGGLRVEPQCLLQVDWQQSDVSYPLRGDVGGEVSGLGQQSLTLQHHRLQVTIGKGASLPLPLAEVRRHPPVPTQSLPQVCNARHTKR